MGVSKLESTSLLPSGSSQAKKDGVATRRKVLAQAAGPAAVTAAAIGIYMGARAIKRIFDTPSRPYSGNNVGSEYDAWTDEGILEHYWGEHIHLGYYTDEVGGVLIKCKQSTGSVCLSAGEIIFVEMSVWMLHAPLKIGAPIN